MLPESALFILRLVLGKSHFFSKKEGCLFTRQPSLQNILNLLIEIL